MPKTDAQFLHELGLDEVQQQEDEDKKRTNSEDSDVLLVRELFTDPQPELEESESSYDDAANERAVESLGTSNTMIVQTPETTHAPTGNPVESGPLKDAISRWRKDHADDPRQRLETGKRGYFQERLTEEGGLDSSILDVHGHTIRWATICRSDDNKFLESMAQQLRRNKKVHFNNEVIGELQSVLVVGDELKADIFAVPGKWLLLESLWTNGRNEIAITAGGNVLKEGSTTGEKTVGVETVMTPVLEASPALIERIREGVNNV